MSVRNLPGAGIHRWPLPTRTRQSAWSEADLQRLRWRPLKSAQRFLA